MPQTPIAPAERAGTLPVSPVLVRHTRDISCGSHRGVADPRHATLVRFVGGRTFFYVVSDHRRMDADTAVRGAER